MHGAVTGLAWGLRNVWPLFRLTRPLNALLAAVAVHAGMLLAGPAELPYPAVVAAPLAALLLSAFGNVLNDLRDVEVDRVAHPRRPLPSGTARAGTARVLAIVCAAAGLALAFLVGLLAFLVALAVLATLVLYEVRLKRTGLPGNEAVSALAAATFLFGAIASGEPLGAWGYALTAAAMAFLLSLAREVAKDAEDVAGDRGHRRTLPLRIGVVRAGAIAAAMAAAGIAVSWPFLIPLPSCGGGWAAFALVAAADGLAALGAVWCVHRPARAQRLLKAAMAVALAGFLARGLGGC